MSIKKFSQNGLDSSFKLDYVINRSNNLNGKEKNFLQYLSYFKTYKKSFLSTRIF